MSIYKLMGCPNTPRAQHRVKIVSTKKKKITYLKIFF